MCIYCIIIYRFYRRYILVWLDGGPGYTHTRLWVYPGCLVWLMRFLRSVIFDQANKGFCQKTEIQN